MKAVLRRTRISPKKANLVAGMVRGRTVNESLALLKFTPKKGAKILLGVVQSAAANAKNNFNQSFDDLIITKILVTKGPTYKRSLPISRGRTHPIRKRTAHITVEVGLPEGVPAKPAKQTKEDSASAKATSDKKTEKKTESASTSAKATVDKKAMSDSKETAKKMEKAENKPAKSPQSSANGASGTPSAGKSDEKSEKK